MENLVESKTLSLGNSRKRKKRWLCVMYDNTKRSRVISNANLATIVQAQVILELNTNEALKLFGLTQDKFTSFQRTE